MQAIKYIRHMKGGYEYFLENVTQVFGFNKKKVVCDEVIYETHY